MKRNRTVTIDRTHPLVGQRVAIDGSTAGQVITHGVVDRIERSSRGTFAYLADSALAWSLYRVRVVEPAPAP